MNFLDIIILIIMAIVTVIDFIMIAMAVCEKEYRFSVGLFILLFVVLGVLAIPFTIIDKGAGATTGEITSVDKNFFGTTAVFIKSSENQQEEYCIENNDLAKKANEYIGKKVKVTYGERIGLYSTGKCSQAPIDTIELIDE